MTERKLIEAFKAFVQKSVLPYNQGNQILINDWKHFNNIISAQTIDSKQLDFYLYVVNKQSQNVGNNAANNINNSTNTQSPSSFNGKVPLERHTTSNITDFTSNNKYSKKLNQYQGLPSPNSAIQKKNSTLTNSTSSSSRRKNLLSNIQNFQIMLNKNQQRLQVLNRSATGAQSNVNPNMSSSNPNSNTVNSISNNGNSASNYGNIGSNNGNIGSNVKDNAFNTSVTSNGTGKKYY